MKIKPLTIMKCFILLLIFIYIRLTPINNFSLTIDPLVVLILSVVMILKSRNNLPLTLMFVFILYCNYSFVIGEYFVGEHLSVPFTAVKTSYIYGLTIRIMLLFMSIISLFYNKKEYSIVNDRLKPQDNVFLFFLIVCLIIFSLILGIDRSNLDSYEVRVSALFEYAKLLFLFAFCYMGRSKINKVIIITLASIFILQDTLYGGRITSLQILLFLAVTFLINKLSFKKVIAASIVGIIFMGGVGAYRNNYTLDNFNILSFIKNLYENFFVFDTATYAYYASATHVAAAEATTMGIKLQSLLDFVMSIVTGIDGTSNVTNLVSKLGFFNMGGGLLPTHFYFWLGWPGVIIIGFFVVVLINNLRYDKVYQHLLFLGVIINVPRWYLYSPNQLFRGSFILTILFFIFWAIKTITSKKKNISNIIDL